MNNIRYKARGRFDGCPSARLHHDQSLSGLWPGHEAYPLMAYVQGHLGPGWFSVKVIIAALRIIGIMKVPRLKMAVALVAVSSTVVISNL
jgi:hypothetical protein